MTLPLLPPLRLDPAMPRFAAPDFPGARWIGSLDVSSLGRPVIVLSEADGYSLARFLIRDGATVLGFVNVEAPHGTVDMQALRREVASLPVAASQTIERTHPSVTVVICTRDRPQHLRTVLRSVLDLDYPEFTVLVVDNAPATRASHDLVRDEFADPRVSYRLEAIAGTSRARNTGLICATGQIVAYVDDDVVVDRLWLRELMAGFDLESNIGCVTGLVPSGELRTRVQRCFDERVSWAKNLELKLYRLSDPPKNLPMFPFCIGDYGTGANFALRRSTALEIGGFDTALGGGVPTYGGEDIDVFVRTLLHGAALVVQPAAVAWHRHRDEISALSKQARGYGTGLGAWATKLMLNRRSAGMVLTRAPQALVRLIANARPARAESERDETVDSDELARVLARIGWLELLCVATGPLRYAKLRRAGYGQLGKEALERTRSSTRMVQES